MTLLLVAAVWAAALYFLFVVRGWHDWGYQARAALLVVVAVIVPLLLVVLWQQHGARERLATHGLALHPDLGASVGAATGDTLGGRTWIFEYPGGARSLLDFYRDAAHRGGWAIGVDDDGMLILRRDARRLTISARDGRAFFLMSETASH